MNSLYDELRVALHSVWTRRWLVLAVAWGICILGWLAIASIPNRYDSRARLLVDVNEILPDDAQIGGGRAQIDQIRETLTSARNMEKVAATTGLLPAGASERDKANAVAMLQKNIKVVPQQDNIFEITSSIAIGSLSDADNAKLASAVLESLITVFRDDQLRGGRMNAREGLKFLDAQIADREKALREVEARRAAFEAQNIGLVPGGAGSPAQRVETARAELSQIDSQLVAAQAQLAAANGQLASTPATIPGVGGVGGSVARQQLAGAQNELSAMRSRGLTDAHPDVIALKSQIASLKAQADREGSGGGGGVQNPAYASLAAMRAERQATVSALTARKSQLMGDIARITAQQIQNPGIAAEYDRINGEYTAFKAQYDKLLAQREQVRLRGEVQTETDAIRIELLDPPSKPTSPAAPNRPLFLTLVLLAGIGGGVGVAFGLSQVRTSYATAARLERASGLPVIGSITEVLTPERQRDRRKKLVWLAGGGGALVGLYALLLVVEFIQRGMVA
ncbi:XrtA system polysaccharide chain length determinant [Sphingopyxis alaskensis]|jgi:polysaccharide chain length determinant protein (PEP-CTERM system associated)|uniref:Lipopolysaccharide biosynthesis n=1 Tax=Sphingopyxis alaskensis (strain DSM 13593 / LMG 18877 / RB2256) TaxID=317655 RepID=Q1GRT3_SPHAL|nr:XrtA system polysaccharide chain length determinant [Sphingopyxis alaskensis]ABF53639.1 lipopolysaccharide biosynthesis [Sphingopyxis alaskensis RB2256]MCM3419089.1 chain-length determining protein [Sphingopyxis alaskensis]